MRLAEKSLRKVQKKMPKDFEMPKIAVVNFRKHGLNANAIGGYDKNTGILYMNSAYDTPQKVVNFVNSVAGYYANTTEYAPYLHELGHKYYEDCIKSIAKLKSIEYNKAKADINIKIQKYIDEKEKNGLFLKNNISAYAEIGYSRGKYTEVIAECFSVMDSNATAHEMLDLIGGV